MNAPFARKMGSGELETNTPVPPAGHFAAGLARASTLWTLLILLLLIVLFGIASPDFFTRASWLATSQFAVEYLLLGLGETFVIITGGIDLSVGAVLGFSGMVG
ncbi:MAG TPA: hypothetical protein VMA86_05090, partial [Acetobacteraceae bacterium]|nr:hypothetical protein [Acetobacteraceae bacterium]